MLWDVVGSCGIDLLQWGNYARLHLGLPWPNEKYENHSCSQYQLANSIHRIALFVLNSSRWHKNPAKASLNILNHRSSITHNFETGSPQDQLPALQLFFSKEQVRAVKSRKMFESAGCFASFVLKLGGCKTGRDVLLAGNDLRQKDWNADHIQTSNKLLNQLIPTKHRNELWFTGTESSMWFPLHQVNKTRVTRAYHWCCQVWLRLLGRDSSWAHFCVALW